MKVSVRGGLFDLLAFRGLPGQRKKRIARASAEPLAVHAVNELARQLHPAKLHLQIIKVAQETASSRTYRLVADPDQGTESLPYFRAGQYLSLKVDVDGVRVTRPCSISSAPYESLGEQGFYEVTLRKIPDGFLTPFVWEHWGVGTKVESSAPLGVFYHEPLRDSEQIIGLAGGSGITPFRSMAREIVSGKLAAKLLLLYGSSQPDDILFYDELLDLQRRSDNRLRTVHVLSCDGIVPEGCEQGFISAEMIRKHADPQSGTFFVCGPQAMYQFVGRELASLQVPRRRVRWEAYGEVRDIGHWPGFPTPAVGKVYRANVHINGRRVEIPARADETLLVAFERANLGPPSHCRSGECGYCRSRLVSGEVFVVPETDGRRAADRTYGFIHPCSSYPISDVEVVVPADV